MRNGNRILTILQILIMLAVTANISNAQDKAQDRVQSYLATVNAGCGEELAKYCRDVAGGEGRLLACLYSHESKLSDRCGNIVMSSMERLGVALGALANVARVCQADAQRLCNGVIAGEGNLVGCLSKAKSSVSAQCNTTLDAAMLNGMGDR
jgi:hypothetical protein